MALLLQLAINKTHIPDRKRTKRPRLATQLLSSEQLPPATRWASPWTLNLNGKEWIIFRPVRGREGVLDRGGKALWDPCGLMQDHDYGGGQTPRLDCLVLEGKELLISAKGTGVCGLVAGYIGNQA